MAAFSLRLNLAIEVNRHFLENEYGDLSFLVVDMRSIETTIC